MSKIDLVVWDWNGTILNDAEISAGIPFQKILKELGDKRTASVELYRDHFQVPLRKVYETLGYGHLSDEEITRINKLWQEEYSKHEQTIPLHKGVVEALEILDQKQIPSIILSNHIKKPIEKRLQDLQLPINHVLANETYEQSITSGKRHMLEKYFAENNHNPERTAIIGDSVEEYLIAQHFKMTPIILTNGYFSVARLNECVPEEYLTTSDDIPHRLIKIFT